jgi:hypothetical protein
VTLPSLSLIVVNAAIMSAGPITALASMPPRVRPSLHCSSLIADTHRKYQKVPLACWNVTTMKNIPEFFRNKTTKRHNTVNIYFNQRE